MFNNGLHLAALIVALFVTNSWLLELA